MAYQSGQTTDPNKDLEEKNKQVPGQTLQQLSTQSGAPQQPTGPTAAQPGAAQASGSRFTGLSKYMQAQGQEKGQTIAQGAAGGIKTQAVEKIADLTPQINNINQGQQTTGNQVESGTALIPTTQGLVQTTDTSLINPNTNLEGVSTFIKSEPTVSSDSVKKMAENVTATGESALTNINTGIQNASSTEGRQTAVQQVLTPGRYRGLSTYLSGAYGGEQFQKTAQNLGTASENVTKTLTDTGVDIDTIKSNIQKIEDTKKTLKDNVTSQYEEIQKIARDRAAARSKQSALDIKRAQEAMSHLQKGDYTLGEGTAFKDVNDLMDFYRDKGLDAGQGLYGLDVSKLDWKQFLPSNFNLGSVSTDINAGDALTSQESQDLQTLANIAGTDQYNSGSYDPKMFVSNMGGTSTVQSQLNEAKLNILRQIAQQTLIPKYGQAAADARIAAINDGDTSNWGYQDILSQLDWLGRYGRGELSPGVGQWYQRDFDRLSPEVQQILRDNKQIPNLFTTSVGGPGKEVSTVTNRPMPRILTKTGQ